MDYYVEMERYDRYMERSVWIMVGFSSFVAFILMVVGVLTMIPVPLSENAQLEIQAVQENPDHVFDVEGGKIITTSSGYEYIIINSKMNIRAYFDKDFNLLKANQYIPCDLDALNFFIIFSLGVPFIIFIVFFTIAIISMNKTDEYFHKILELWP